jgi:hypothetical protein
MGLDLNKDYNSAKSKISAYGTVIDNKKNTALKQKEKVKSSVDKKKSDVVNQINELKSGTNDIKNQIKSQVKDQLEELLDIFKTTLNSKTSKYKSMSSVVEFFLKAAENTKPRIKEILIDEIVTMIGCSEEQSYNDMVFSQNQQGQKLYIKVSQVDLFKKLQLGPDDEKAKYFYEDTETPPGYLPFSCNRDLYNRLQTGQSISQQTGSDYLGESGQALFDIKYVTSYIPPTGPPIPVTGDFFEIELKNQINNRTSVSDFLRDYYGTLDILDFNILSAELMNTLTGVFDFSMGISSDELREQKKFDLILKRIMGICNDPTKKIDVQGTAKLPELDNIDDSFFDISNQELRNIEAQINNTLQGNVEFEGCDGIILPIPVKATLENLDDIIKENNYNNVSNSSIQTTADFTYKVPFIKGLEIKGMASYDYRISMIKTLFKKYLMYDYNASTDVYVPTAFNDPSLIGNDWNYSHYLTLQAQASYKTTIAEKHNIAGTVVFESRDQGGRFQNLQMEYSFYTNDQISQASKTHVTPSGNEWQVRSMSYLGRFNYDYLGKYLLEFSGRYDGSYRYAPAVRWGFFPVLSGGWRISEERFLKNNVSWLSNLKLRASIGKIGQDVGNPFQFVQGFSTSGGGSYEFSNGVLTNGAATPAMVNDNLTWMVSNIKDIGIDIGVFNEKLTLTADVYQRDRTGLLAYRNVTLPNTFAVTVDAGTHP